MAAQGEVMCEENGVTAWDMMPLDEKLAAAAKEQECAGARRYREALDRTP